MWIDTHAHLDSFGAETAALLDRAAAAGVHRVIAIGGHEKANETAARLAGEFPGRVFAAVGLDRDQAEAEPDGESVRAFAGREDVVAIGEVGLDYHYLPETAPRQRRLLERMMEIARESARPLVLHTRDADEDTLAMLKAYGSSRLSDPSRPGVVHCFTGSTGFARKILDLGWYISISGIVTFPKADNVRAAAKYIPADRLLLETDTPYLAPVPHRGQGNEPAYLPLTARAVAEVRGITLEALAVQTSRNAETLFRRMKKNDERP